MGFVAIGMVRWTEVAATAVATDRLVRSSLLSNSIRLREAS